MNAFIKLDGADNVAVALRDLRKGETLEVDGNPVVLHDDIAFGHKFCTRRIARGENVLKYGLPIGSATRDILEGEHVHTHNIQSNYKNDNQ